jgi:hypothetical protein
MSDSPATRDIIDLTAELSDLDTRDQPSISSARKRNRDTAVGQLDQNDGLQSHTKKSRKCADGSDRHQHHHHHRKARFIGEPLSVKSGKFQSLRQDASHREKGEERVYSGVQYGKLLVEVSQPRWYRDPICVDADVQIGAMVFCNDPASGSR